MSLDARPQVIVQRLHMPAGLVTELAIDDIVLRVLSDHVTASSAGVDSIVTAKLAGIENFPLLRVNLGAIQESHHIRQLLTYKANAEIE